MHVYSVHQSTYRPTNFSTVELYFYIICLTLSMQEMLTINWLKHFLNSILILRSFLEKGHLTTYRTSLKKRTFYFWTIKIQPKQHQLRMILIHMHYMYIYHHLVTEKAVATLILQIILLLSTSHIIFQMQICIRQHVQVVETCMKKKL